MRNYQKKVLKDLQYPGLASAYLREALIGEDPRVFLLRLKNVWKAQGEEMTALGKPKKEILN